jgi:hypothetical protein
MGRAPLQGSVQAEHEPERSAIHKLNTGAVQDDQGDRLSGQDAEFFT